MSGSGGGGGGDVSDQDDMIGNGLGPHQSCL